MTSPPDSISQAKIASQKLSEEKRRSGEKYVTYYRPVYVQRKTNAVRVLHPFLRKKDLIVVYQALILSFMEYTQQTQSQNDVIRRYSTSFRRYAF